jgi:predicted dehydrogenase
MEPTHRRTFLKAAGATAALSAFPNILFGAPTNNAKLKIGLIGCGGRGTGAAETALLADANTVLWAIGDVFETQIPKALNNLKRFEGRLEVTKERQFSGLDAYLKVIESGVDVVLLATPPGFRPQQMRAAIEAGKHVFAEKPMAVDVAGVKSVMETARLAKEKGLTLQHGYCWRFDPGVREGYGKVLSGELGRVLSVYGTYLANVPKPSTSIDQRDPKWGDVEWQVRNWMGHEWLSGGPLLEQCIHTVDKVSWAMGDVDPISARGGGGRTQREDDGNVWDHYDVAFEYPGGVFCHVGQRQYRGCFNEVVDRVFCEKGTLQAPGRVFTKGLDDKITWAFRSPANENPDNMYQLCHDQWFAAIRKGEALNTGDLMVRSTMLGILGREAAHTGQRVTWEQLWKSEQDHAPDTLKLSDAHPVAPVPKPGTHKI